MKAQFLTDLILRNIDGKYSVLQKDFTVYSHILGCYICVPAGFISDTESVPLFRSTSKRAGVIHDYLCRMDVIPVVTKQRAASVYHEMMTCRDKKFYSNEPWYFRSWLFFYRWVKSSVVRIVWGYWKKHKVTATYEELKT